MKLKSEFDNLVSKIKIPGSEVSFWRFSYVIHFFLCHLNGEKIENGVDRRRHKLVVQLGSQGVKSNFESKSHSNDHKVESASCFDM